VRSAESSPSESGCRCFTIVCSMPVPAACCNAADHQVRYCSVDAASRGWIDLCLSNLTCVVSQKEGALCAERIKSLLSGAGMVHTEEHRVAQWLQRSGRIEQQTSSHSASLSKRWTGCLSNTGAVMNGQETMIGLARFEPCLRRIFGDPMRPRGLLFNTPT